jgi:6-phosphogluconolactonase (cycloisomerase 2 family)
MAPTPRPLKFRLHATSACALALLSATFFLAGCGSFFTCEGKSDCPVTCTTNCTASSSTDYAYVANSATSANDLNGYNLGAGTLTATTSSPYSLGYSPSSMVVSHADTFLYAATDSLLSTGEIYAYSIGTGGNLTILGGGKPQIGENDAALAISPDGQWLFTLPTAALILNEYSANTSTGTLGGLQNSYDLSSAPSGTITPLSIAVAPSGQYFAAALATGGANVFPFDTTTGGEPSGQSGVLIDPGSAQNGIYALAFDSNNYLYCVTTNGLQVFSVTSGATVTAVGSAYTLGNQPRSIAIASTTTTSGSTTTTTPNYVYIGNEADGTISAYAIGTAGALTTVPGSPFTGPTSVNSLAVDSTGKYLIASGYNASTGIQLFTIGSNGALTSSGTAGTGTSTLIPGSIAATH